MADEFIKIPLYLIDESEIEQQDIGVNACDACMYTCEYCESSCEKTSCQSGCTSCETCQTTCQIDCQTYCQIYCEVGCQISCQTSCEISNQCNLCESFCQNCETCQTACESCEGTCEGSCETACLYYCEGCESACESCQSGQSPTENVVLTITEITATSCLATISGLDPNVSYYYRIQWYDGGNFFGNSDQVISGASKRITGLIPDASTYIRAEIWNADDQVYLDYFQQRITTLPLIEGLWEWWTPKTETNLGVTPDEWLAFCNKINEVRVANGLAAYGFTTSSTYIAKDKKFYAWMWLQAANAINDLGTGVAVDCLNVKSFIDSMNSNSLVYPWYWDNLRTALNNAIN